MNLFLIVLWMLSGQLIAVTLLWEAYTEGRNVTWEMFGELIGVIVIGAMTGPILSIYYVIEGYLKKNKDNVLFCFKKRGGSE